ncbi:MAG: cupin domain-containing protein [Alphaproteobacteria bacterium]|nr:cupin domain-containing protein [Alphaproteobacteria bacterium]
MTSRDASAGTAPRIVRRGDFVPCRTAFIDAHTPGSDEKENFAIIGGGVSESRDQHVHIRETPGFNVGAAGQPPGCRNSLHYHRTAEVFFVLGGRWRFFWGRRGDAGEAVLGEGDIFDIPTGVFRGFENVGDGYGMLMALLGGDDAGGGVVWTPEVLSEARAHGLVLGEDGVLYDSAAGEFLPEGVGAMAPLTEAALAEIPEPGTDEVVSGFVARFGELMEMTRLSGSGVLTIGDGGVIDDCPGFAVEFLSGHSEVSSYATERHEVLMAGAGEWRLSWSGGEEVLSGGDVCLVPRGLRRTLCVADDDDGRAYLYRVRDTDDPAGPTRVSWKP